MNILTMVTKHKLQTSSKSHKLALSNLTKDSMAVPTKYVHKKKSSLIISIAIFDDIDSKLQEVNYVHNLNTLMQSLQLN